MQLLQVLSKKETRRKKRRKMEFLLPETRAVFQRFQETTRELRSQRIASILAYGKSCLIQAKTLSKEAKLILSVRHENDAEYELARRQAKHRKDEAVKLRKRGRAFTLRARRIALCFWQFPDELDTKKDSPPNAFWKCRGWARYQAYKSEIAKIVEEGEVVHETHELAKEKEYWHHERRLVRYCGQIFLAVMAKRVDAQPHDPWQISWVTNSPSQMTEQELRIVASQSDRA